jgi:sugar diacid utilization regulator
VTPDAGVEAAIQVIAQRLAAERETLARRIAECLSIVSPPASLTSDKAKLFESRLSVALELIDTFLAGLNGTEPLPPAEVERTRQVATRRVHERVSLAAFLHSTRVWGELVWDAVVASARMSEPQEREAAIQIASRLMRQVDAISSVATGAYLDEITDRGLLRRDLMDALISGAQDDSRRLARSLRIKLSDAYIVVVIRSEEMHGELGRDEPFQARVDLDRIVETTRRQFQPADGSLLAGMAHGDVVVLFPASGPNDIQRVREASVTLAQLLPPDVTVGMSAYHRGLAAISIAHAEARAAAEISDRLGLHGRVVGLEDVLVDHLLRASSLAQGILADAMQPVVEYDQQHSAELIATLRAFVETRFNLTQSAGLLSVHPNTVVYRLRRVREIAGRDPHNTDDLLVLWLGLKVLDLGLRGGLI